MNLNNATEGIKFFDYYSNLKIPLGDYIIIRLNGNQFSNLSKKLNLKVPFDEFFRNCMVRTTQYLMQRFNIIYGYTQNDKISLLFSINRFKNNNSNNLLHTTSILSGESSAFFSLTVNDNVVFKLENLIVISEIDSILKYFKWDRLNSQMVCISSYLSTIRNNSNIVNETSITKQLEILQHNNITHIPHWQMFGIGLYWTIPDIYGNTKRDLTVEYNLSNEIEFNNKLIELIKYDNNFRDHTY